MEHVKYCIATESGCAKMVGTAIKEIDRNAVIDPEGNPARLWATTVLTPEMLMNLDYVEDVIKSCDQPEE